MNRIDRWEQFLSDKTASLGLLVDRWLRWREPGSMASTELLSMLRQEIDRETLLAPNGTHYAPHLIKVTIGWLPRAGRPKAEIRKLLEEIRQAANNYRLEQNYEIFAAVKVILIKDIFSDNLRCEASFGDLVPKFEGGELLNSVGSRDFLSRNVKTQVEFRIYTPASLTNRVNGGEITFTHVKRQASIGRSEDNAVCINHVSVAEIHAICALTLAGDLMLADLNTPSGTYINGRRLNYGEVLRVNGNDTVSFGDVTVSIKITRALIK